jgi:hypothetical protein
VNFQNSPEIRKRKTETMESNSSWEMLFHPDIQPDLTDDQEQKEYALDDPSVFSDVFSWQRKKEPIKEIQKKPETDVPAFSEIFVSWKAENTPELEVLNDFDRQHNALIAELASTAEVKETKPYNYSDFSKTLATRKKLRKAKQRLMKQLAKGAKMHELSLSHVPPMVAKKMEIEEKEEDEAEYKALYDQATILESETSTLDHFKIHNTPINATTTPLSVLKELCSKLGIRDAAKLRASEMVDRISTTLKAMGRFYNNAPEVADVLNRPILTRSQVEEKWSHYKKNAEQKRKESRLPYNGTTVSHTITERLPREQVKVLASTQLFQEEEEHEGEDDDIALSETFGGPWFATAPQIGGVSYNQALDQVKEGMLKVLIDNYFIRDPDLTIMGVPDPINNILPIQEMNYNEKLQRTDFLFGKRENGSLNMDKLFSEWLGKTAEEKDKEKLDAGRLPDFRNMPVETKTQLAWRLVARASPRMGDFALLEKLLATIPYDVDLGAVDKESGETLLMHAISKGKYIDINDPESDSNPFRMVALLLSAAKTYGTRPGGGGYNAQINLNAIDNDGNNLGIRMALKCAQLHIEVAQFRQRYSKEGLAAKEELRRKIRMEKEIGMKPSYKSFGIFGSDFESKNQDPEEEEIEYQTLPDSKINKIISNAEQRFHATLVALLRPDVLASYFTPLLPLVFTSAPKPFSTPLKTSKCDREPWELQPLDVNYHNKGVTLASYCAQNNCFLCIRCIQLHAFPDFSIREEKTGMTAFDYAVRSDNPLQVAYMQANGKINYFNRNRRNETIFHIAARHRWNLCYDRHPLQKEVMKESFPVVDPPSSTNKRAPSILELVWTGFSRFLVGFVNIEVNEKAREMKYAGTAKRMKQGKDKTSIPLKLIGTSAPIPLNPAASASKSQFESLGDEQKEQLRQWRRERYRQLRSLMLDTLSVDGVTPLWISALIRDFNSFEFFIRYHADPTIKNRPDAQGITMQDALVDLLPPDLDDAKKKAREKIILLLGKVASDIAMSRRIKESEMRSKTVLPEEIEGDTERDDSKTKVEGKVPGQSKWNEEIKDLYKELVQALRDHESTNPEGAKRFMNSYKNQTLERIRSEAPDERQRKIQLASRKAQAGTNGVKNVETIISKIEDKVSEPRSGEWLIEKLQGEDDLKWLYEPLKDTFWDKVSGGGYARAS